MTTEATDWQARAESADPRQLCIRCRVPLEPGIALVQTTRSSSDLGGIYTVSPGGPGRIVQCLKCPNCGWSVTI